jgi:hypothetical protein
MSLLHAVGKSLKLEHGAAAQRPQRPWPERGNGRPPSPKLPTMPREPVQGHREMPPVESDLRRAYTSSRLKERVAQKDKKSVLARARTGDLMRVKHTS